MAGYNTKYDGDGDNTAQAIKTTPGRLRGVEVSNPNSVDCWLQLFDALIANITVGTTAPKLSLFVPAGDGSLDGAMDKDFGPDGLVFLTAISYACTTTPSSNGDPTTGLIVNAWYE